MQNKLTTLPYHRWLIFLVIALGIFMSTLTSSIVDIALPQVIAGLHTDLGMVQWVVSAYLLVITSLLPLAGRLGDIYGRKMIYSFGYLGFVGGSALCGFAQSIEVLIAARMVQAVGAAALMAIGPAILVSCFSPQERGKVLGMTGTAVALGALTGPSLGGLLIEAFSWHAVFFVNLPVGFLGFLGSRLIVPADSEMRAGKMDYPGAVLFTMGMTSLLLILSHGMSWGWHHPLIQVCLVLAPAAFVLFIRHERRVAQPMLNLAIFHNWPFLAGNLAGLLSFMALFSNIILLPYFLYEVMAQSPVQIGLVMSVYPLVMAVTAPLSGLLSDRIGARVLTTTGLGLLALGLGYLANMAAGTSLWQIMAGQAVMGFGNGLFQSPNNNSVMSSVTPDHLGIAGGILALARNFGMVCGTAVAVAIFEYRRAALAAPEAAGQLGAFIAGYHDALSVASGLVLVAAVISLNRKGHAGGGEWGVGSRE